MTGLFFHPPRKFILALMANATGKLTIEIPVFQRGDQPVSFQLKGVDAVAKSVLESCAPKKKKSKK